MLGHKKINKQGYGLAKKGHGIAIFGTSPSSLISKMTLWWLVRAKHKQRYVVFMALY